MTLHQCAMTLHNIIIFCRPWTLRISIINSFISHILPCFFKADDFTTKACVWVWIQPSVVTVNGHVISIIRRLFSLYTHISSSSCFTMIWWCLIFFWLSIFLCLYEALQEDTANTNIMWISIIGFWKLMHFHKLDVFMYSYTNKENPFKSPFIIDPQIRITIYVLMH